MKPTSEPGQRTPTPTQAESPTQAGEQAGRTKAEIERAASKVKESVKERARTGLEDGRRSAAERAGEASEAIDRAAASFSAEGQETLAHMTTTLAGKLSTLARYVETHSLDELTQEARALGRRNPGILIAGGVALGLALSRFFKASAEG